MKRMVAPERARKDALEAVWALEAILTTDDGDPDLYSR